MKRYRVMTAEFDYRANTLNVDIKDEWHPSVKEMWRNIQNGVTNELIYEFGYKNSKIKLENLNEIGAKPSSVIAYHNSFFHR